MIVLNYNDFENTVEYTHKIHGYKCIDKIIIVDNKSTDDSLKEFLIFQDSMKVDVISSDKNAGYGSGNNVALKYIDEKYKVEKVVISNPDIDISEESFNKILAAVDDTQFVAAGGVVYDRDGIMPDKFAWKLPKYSYLLVKKIFPMNVYLNRKKYSTQYTLEELNENNSVDVISGCFFAIKFEEFKKVGYFSEDTFLYYEEDILFHKLKKEKYQSCIVLDAPLIHYGGTSTKKNLKNYMKVRDIHGASERVYIEKCLKKNKFQLFLFDFIFEINKYMNVTLRYIVDSIIIRRE